MIDAFSLLKKIDAEMVLDAATGRGDFINILKQNLRSYTQIIGVDGNERVVDMAQKLFPENDVEIYQMDLEDLQFDAAYFDLVTLSNSLHHLEHPDKVFAELLRVLKPGGTLLVTEMYRDGDQSEAQQTHILMHHWLAGIDRRYGIHHQSTYARDELAALFARLKLKHAQTVDFYFPVDNPKEARNCESLKRNVAECFKRIDSLEDADELRAEGNQILDRINKVGCASPSRLILTGVKPTPPKTANTKGDK